MTTSRLVKMADPVEAGGWPYETYRHGNHLEERESTMYVIVHHRFSDPPTALAARREVIKNQDVPAGTRGLQFYPNRNGSEAVCLWESESVADVQGYVDDTLGDASKNMCWEVDGDQAFADLPFWAGRSWRLPAARRRASSLVSAEVPPRVLTEWKAVMLLGLSRSQLDKLIRSGRLQTGLKDTLAELAAAIGAYVSLLTIEAKADSGGDAT